MKNSLLFTFLLLFVAFIGVNGQGTETFANYPETGGSYVDGTFTGQDGSTWTYVQCRGDVQIDNQTPMLGKDRTTAANIESGTISGGCGELSLSYMQAFSTNVNLEVQVNGSTVATLTSSGEQNVVKSSGAIVVNVSGDFVIKLVQPTGAGQVCVDNITWTAYSSGTPNAVTPVFSPVGGIYMTAQDIAITSETEGASIYYTTDGSEPNETSTLYTAPFQVSSTVTIKAKAYKDGYNESGVAAATYTFPEEVANIAALRAKVNDGGTYVLTGEAVIAFMQANRNQKVIQDATGGVTVDDAAGIITSTYAQYDGMTGLVGSLSKYGELIQFIPAQDPGAPSSSNNEVTPAVVTIPTLQANWEMYESTLITIENLTIEGADGTVKFVNSTNYNVADNSANAYVVRTGYRDIDLIGTVVPSKADITGIAQRYNTTYQMFPRSLSDVKSISTSINGNEQTTVKVSPNPFTTELKVAGDNVVGAMLYNAAGQLVKDMPYVGGTISTADLNKGMYILQIKLADGTVATQKVIKK